jgi:hypothetical protein
MWTSDPYYIQNIGIVNTIHLTKKKALKVLDWINRSEDHNFGYQDWRIPTKKELKHMLKFLEQSTGNAPRFKGNTNKVYLWPVRGASIEKGFHNVVLFALNSIHIQQNTAIISGDVVVNNASPGPTLSPGVELELSNNVNASADTNLFADKMLIRSASVINGDVYVNELENKGLILGDILPVNLPVFDLLPPFYTGAPENGTTYPDILVKVNQELVLAEGIYGNLIVKNNGKIKLTGGVYEFKNVTFGNHTIMSFAAPTQIRISDKFLSGTNSFIGPEKGCGVLASEIVFYIKGLNGTDGALDAPVKAAQIGVNNDVQANFYVPNGTLYFRQNTDAEGAFLASDILISQSSSFILNSYFINNAPVTAEDIAHIFAGSTVSVFDGKVKSVLANDYDPEGHAMYVNTTPVLGPSHGTLVLNSDGTFEYSHDGSSNDDSFTYEVCDNHDPAACSTGVARFFINPDTITVTVKKAGEGSGKVYSSPKGISCGLVCETQFGTGQMIYLYANADDGSVFTGWTGDKDCSDGMLTPDGDKNCVANFELESPPPTEEITLTITKAGNGSGRVVSKPLGIDCGTICSNVFPQFSRIYLKAIPDPGSIFLGWSGDTTNGIIDAEKEDCQATATFQQAPQTYTLTIQFLGTGLGNVSGSTAGVYCSSLCSVEVEQGKTVEISARAEKGSVFTGWGGDISSSYSKISFTMDSNKSLTVTFDLSN